MLSLNMSGSYSFTSESIDEIVTKTSPGNYALGYRKVEDNKRTFIVQYVGRSDSDLAKELKSKLSLKKYKRFMYSYASSPKQAFEKECKNYHDFGGKKLLDNEVHPARPKDTDWKCPVCRIFD